MFWLPFIDWLRPIYNEKCFIECLYVIRLYPYLLITRKEDSDSFQAFTAVIETVSSFALPSSFITDSWAILINE